MADTSSTRSPDDTRSDGITMARIDQTPVVVDFEAERRFAGGLEPCVAQADSEANRAINRLVLFNVAFRLCNENA